MSFYIETYNFSKPVHNESGKLLADDVMGENWPVVYLLHGNKEIYIGETSDANSRMLNHLDPNGKYYAKRKKLDKVEILFDTTYNKSAILDIEQSLIRLFKFEIRSNKSLYFSKIQNGNNGQSRQHNYYKRAHYQQEVENIWKELVRRQIASMDYQDIVNDSIFKFSPYSTLNIEQNNVCLDILESVLDSLTAQKLDSKSSDFTAVVRGSAGTGKTIIIMHMMSIIAEAMNSKSYVIDSDEDEMDDEDAYLRLASLNRTHTIYKRIREYVSKYGKLKIAYVAQMTSLRQTIKQTFANIDYLKKGDAIGPNDVINKSFSKGQFEKFDVIFVDEAHRLWQRKKIQNMESFDKACKRLYGNDCDPNTKTALDWLLDCSKTRVLIYDTQQTVKESDITDDQFRTSLSSHQASMKNYTLKQQMRCAGGIDFLKYLNDIFDCPPHLEKRNIEDFDFKLYPEPNHLINSIVERNFQFGLGRIATGYGWQWKKKKYDRCEKEYNEAVARGDVKDSRSSKLDYYLNHLSIEDGLIDFSGTRYVRNMDFNWIINGNPKEIGCIHTSQGYDLNYVGVLFGPEIDYVEGKGIVIYPEKIEDSSVGTSMTNLSPEDRQRKEQGIKNYVLNAYKVMMERGIKGCYVWAYNNGLQEYFKRYINLA